MKISSVNIEITENDLYGILEEVVRDFAKIEDLKIENVIINEKIIIEGNYKWKFNIPFKAEIDIVGVIENTLICTLSKIKVLKIGILSPVQNLVEKKIIKSLQFLGITYRNKEIRVDLNTINQLIPAVNYELTSIELKEKLMVVTAKTIFINMNKEVKTVDDLKLKAGLKVKESDKKDEDSKEETKENKEELSEEAVKASSAHKEDTENDENLAEKKVIEKSEVILEEKSVPIQDDEVIENNEVIETIQIQGKNRKVIEETVIIEDKKKANGLEEISISGVKEEELRGIPKPPSYSKIREEITTTTPSKYSKVMEYVLVIPDMIVLLTRLFKDKRVPTKTKVLIGATLGYLACPIDILPDSIPIIGKIDDVTIVFYVLDKAIREIPQDVLVSNWQGKKDVIVLIREGAEYLTEVIGAQNTRKIIGVISGLFAFKKKSKNQMKNEKKNQKKFKKVARAKKATSKNEIKDKDIAKNKEIENKKELCKK